MRTNIRQAKDCHFTQAAVERTVMIAATEESLTN